VSDGTETVRLEAFASLQDHERGMLEAVAGPAIRLARGKTLRPEGERDPQLYLLASGWAASTIRSPAGSRQLLKIHMPGDMMGLPSLAYHEAVDTIVALTPIVVHSFPSAAIGAMFASHPRIAALLFLISQEERTMLADRVAAMGRAGAVQRVAALILQLHARVMRHDPATGDSFHVPIRQAELADLAGITTVHVNRVLQELRARELVHWSRQTITILDQPGLRALAGLPERTMVSEPDWLPDRSAA
jgi:CRP/FNR family transcriptional regulator, anaerobic regulatory protein